MSIFLSYSGQRIERTALHRAFRDYGLTPWRDVENLGLGDDTTESIEHELADCSGVILWVNDDILNSAYVARVELPAILRAWTSRRLRIAPIFDGMTPNDAIERLSQLGFEPPDHRNHRTSYASQGSLAPALSGVSTVTSAPRRASAAANPGMNAPA